MSVILKNKHLIDKETGELICENVTPKFQGLTYDNYRQAFKRDKSIRYLNPMKAEELMGEKLDEVLEDPNTIAEQKWDGHRALAYCNKNANRLFSRNISKESNWFTENSDQMPHIRDLVRVSIAGSVIDGEITLPIKNCCCRDVQSVTGALPETAIANQLEKGLATLNTFDILYYRGLNVQHFPLWKRKVYLWKVVQEFNSPYIRMCTIYATVSIAQKLKELWRKYDRNVAKGGLLNIIRIVDDYGSLYKEMIERGDEGIILKNLYSEYEQKRSNKFVKMKGHNTYDCVILGYEEPTKDFDGKTELSEWQYWYHPESDSCLEGTNDMSNIDLEGSIPVTKFFCKGWIGAIHVGVYKVYDRDKLSEKDLEFIKETSKLGDFAVLEDEYEVKALIQVARCSGLNDDIRAEISKHRDNYLGAVVEVEAQKIINNGTGSLQHPRFICFRPDKNAEECTFEAHIRRYGEDK